jgi:hypothetical protein
MREGQRNYPINEGKFPYWFGAQKASYDNGICIRETDHLLFFAHLRISFPMYSE